MNGHGPDQASYEKALASDLKPVKIGGTMAFMFETRHVVRATAWATNSPTMQLDYDDVWRGFRKATLP
jgi:homogentisate 1,2-dioxygenase